jgi:two-component system chemotaxis response regulator CheB
MARRDIIVIGASAGGLQPLRDLIGGLPGNFPASLFVVVHTSPTGSGYLPEVLGRSSLLKTMLAEDGQKFSRGSIYIAPADHHLLIKGDRLRVTSGPKENGFRPAIDPLFRTAARTCGSRVIGVILSGAMDDGTLGLMEVKEHHGIAIVQDPTEALFPFMPASAVQNLKVDYVLRAAAIPEVLGQLISESIGTGANGMSRARNIEQDVAEVGTDALVTHELPSPPSGLTCPECGGALWELNDGKPMHFRCHVGHGYTAASLLVDQDTHLEAALWVALRALEENAALRRRMAERTAKRKLSAVADEYTRRAEEVEKRAQVIRTVLMDQKRAVQSAPRTKPRRGKRKRTAGSKAGG